MSKLVEVVSRQPDLLTKQAIAYITGFATVRVPPTVRDLLLPSPNVAQRGHIEELCSGVLQFSRDALKIRDCTICHKTFGVSLVGRADRAQCPVRRSLAPKMWYVQ